ncbi:FAD/NAD(P)-binding domain-containing protein [Vararia minispora EC-137]|uniref:FAD/NAD(P)-binding domain-containing protein n=1 Tax=Vararia minispora EC-137 TaxID=1314806 RepID=A0ACB8QP94_9AGAM|nr:FAD/NAD(P)-binding domain-containing protein [Vararia minispora EC-137]
MSATAALSQILRDYVAETTRALAHRHVFHALSPYRAYQACFLVSYILVQRFLIIPFFKQYPPKKETQLPKPYGRIAIIGAGLTGVSSAAHCISHNFERVGGIWRDVNNTSALQLNSLIYRFHPGVLWKHTYPTREEILSEIKRIWEEYKLKPRTRFNTPVRSVRREEGTESPGARWIINDGHDGPFDAVIVTVGTCGRPKMVEFPGMPRTHWQDEQEREDKEMEEIRKSDENTFQGTVLHSSELDTAEIENKTVLIIGSGASGVEAAETALAKGATKVAVIARDDKWIIPRNTFIDTLISAQPFGREMPLSFVWEWFIRTFHYRDLKDLSPANLGIYEGTPVVNNAFLQHVREKRIEYVRGDTERLTPTGVRVNIRPRGTKPGDKPSMRRELSGDVIILATGFKRPSLDFLPDDLFPEEYSRPDLYLQNFSTKDWSVLCTNSAYMNAIGTVGHFHIGIYTRILLLFLREPNARPEESDMRLWVNTVRFVKRGARGGALGFFTYMELVIWFLTFHLFRPDRLWWILFTMQGWGVPIRN